MLTRWDASHSKRIEITQQTITDETAANDARYYRLKIFTDSGLLADIFRVPFCRDQHRIYREHIAALERGDHVFFLQMGEHSSSWFRLCPEYPGKDWDNWCAGIVIVNREFWHRAMPRTTFAASYVFRKLSDAFDDRVTAILNGWIYSADVYDENGDILETYCDALSPEAALLIAQEDFPEIQFSEGDFEAVTRYCLRASHVNLHMERTA